MNATSQSGPIEGGEYLYAIAALPKERTYDVAGIHGGAVYSVRNVNEAANLNCLVGRRGQTQLEEAVFQAARLFDNNYAFDLNGPWAPQNFVEMDLQLNGRT
jgi:hypothetical protein